MEDVEWQLQRQLTKKKYERWIEEICHASAHHYKTQHCHLLDVPPHGIPLSLTGIVQTHFEEGINKSCKGMKNILFAQHTRTN